MKKKIIKAIIISLLVLGLTWFYQSYVQISPQQIRDWILSFGVLAPVLFMIIYTIRPLILFPASILSLGGGLASGAFCIFKQKDTDMIPPIQEALDKELTLLLNSKVEKVQTTEARIIVTISSDDQKQQIEVDELLIATGRKPNIEGLGLEHAGVEIERGHIVVKETLQTTAPNIYAIGDVNGKFPLPMGRALKGKQSSLMLSSG